MKRKTGYLIVLLLIPCIFSGEAASISINFTSNHSSVRCRDGIVSVGDLDRTVADKCGEPLGVTRREADSYDIWIYQFGASKYMYYFGFLHGKLQRIVSAPCSVNDLDCYDLR